MVIRINRRNFMKTVGTGMASLAVPGCLRASGSGEGGSGENKPPNIVIIYIDDLGWGDLGFMGNPYFETPNIDRLASKGKFFSHAYANAPNCAPSRACLLSGQYSPRHGVYTVGHSERGFPEFRKLIPIKNKRVLDTDTVTLAEALKPAGYTSASIGKWHLGRAPHSGPIEHGFDINIGGGRQSVPPNGYYAPFRLPNLDDFSPGEYLTDRLTEEAMKFMEDNKDGPFFLYLSHYAVHSPYQADEKLVKKYADREDLPESIAPEFAAMIENLDQNVGRLLNKLEALRLTENTAIFLLSDNGAVREKTPACDLRGGKGSLYECGLRVPLIVSWQGRIQPGAKCATPVIATDLYPTVLEMAGAPAPEGYALDGESLLPLLSGEGGLERDSIFWHFPAYQERDLVSWRTTPAGAIRQGDWKLIEYFEDGRLELYNLKDDAAEQRNLADEMPEKAKALHNALIRWRQAINAPVPTEKNPLYDPDAEPDLKIIQEKIKAKEEWKESLNKRKEIE